MVGKLQDGRLPSIWGRLVQRRAFARLTSAACRSVEQADTWLMALLLPSRSANSTRMHGQRPKVHAGAERAEAAVGAASRQLLEVKTMDFMLLTSMAYEGLQTLKYVINSSQKTRSCLLAALLWRRHAVGFCAGVGVSDHSAGDWVCCGSHGWSAGHALSAEAVDASCCSVARNAKCCRRRCPRL